MTAADIARAEPEAVGLSSVRLRRFGEAMRREVEAARMPGCVVAIARGGKLAHLEAIGYRDPAAREPLKTDAVFSIASMTKPMTSVAIMMLVEEGRVLLGDPVSEYLPPLAELKVAEPGGGTRAPKQIPTIQDLLRHTSGLTYKDRGTTPAHALYPGSSVWAAERLSKEETIAALAKSPLLFDPGSNWEYGFSTDVLGFVVEAVTGKALGSFLQERLWAPLGMTDTSFALPAAKRSRYALALAKDPVTGNANPSIHHGTDRTQKWESGGGGSVSTAADYLRFTEMLRRGGRLGGAEVLGRETVALMKADHLPQSFNNMIADKMDPAATGYGFGLGFAVRRQTGIAAMAGSAGDYYWSGVYGTYFWIDPKEELSVVFMAAAPGLIRLRYRQMSRNLVYQALTS
ncbi:MAG: serine hydrolase domain-containing protein [Hyphomicrobiaceae bacterium]